MNFIDFLNQSNENLTKPKDENIKQHQEVKVGLYNDKSLKNISIGQTIKVVYFPNSPYNIYKGYIGEIRDYKKENNHAMICLNATNEYKVIQLPLKHFILYDDKNSHNI